MFSRTIPVRDLVVKVYAWSSYKRDGVGEIIQLVFRYDFDFPLLPNPYRIDFTLYEGLFNKQGRFHGSLIKTWDQALKFFHHHIDSNQPFWIKINGIEVNEVRPGIAKVPRVRRPKFWYEISIGSFSFVEFQNSNFVKNLCRT